jgi:hypothetical protein
MKITTVTLLFVLFSIFEICRTVWSVKKETIGIRSAAIWLIMWASIGFFSLFPGLLNAAMRAAQMESRMFFITIISIFVLFALNFGLSSRLEKLQRDIAKAMQEIAMLNYKIDSEKQRKPKEK